MRFSIAEILNYNIYGVPFSGPDACGYAGHPTAELCARWMALSAWYMFARNHNANGTGFQEPFSFPEYDYVLVASAYGLSLRYKMLKY